MRPASKVLHGIMAGLLMASCGGKVVWDGEPDGGSTTSLTTSLSGVCANMAADVTAKIAAASACNPASAINECSINNGLATWVNACHCNSVVLNITLPDQVLVDGQVAYDAWKAAGCDACGPLPPGGGTYCPGKSWSGATCQPSADGMTGECVPVLAP